MKPLYLEFCGVNSFSERAVIDFEKLLSGGIFGVFGDTGAGKSTILDCIGFALYGKVNRIGREGSAMSDIVNYNCVKAEVNFQFETEWNGERAVYRVERTLNRNRGAQKATLYKKEGENFTAICEGASHVNKKIEEEIIGIQFDDFKKCIALPQGEFSQFLQASRKDRLLLVAKLFSLEQYGYALYKKVAERLEVKNAACEGVKGQLKAYEEVTERALNALEEQAKILSSQLNAEQEALKKAREEFNRYEQALKNKQDLQNTQNKLFGMLLREAEMEEKRAALEKLQIAKQISERVNDRENTRKKYEISRTKENGLRLQEQTLLFDLSAKKEKIAFLQLDEKIEEKQKELARVEAAKKDVQALTEAENRLQTARNKYREHNAELKKYVNFNYEGEKSLLSAELEGLPQEDNLLDFVNNHFKSVLLAEEYYTFFEDLTALAEKYPAIRTDIQPLLDKYASRGVKKGVDIYAQAEYFRKSSERKTAVQKRLAELEIINEKYAAAFTREKELREEGERLQAEYLQRKASLTEITALGTLEDIRADIDRLKKNKERKQEECDKLQEHIVAIQREISAKEAEKTAYLSSLEKNKEQIQNLLAQSGIPSEQEAENLLSCYGDPIKLKAETDGYFLERHALQAEEKRLTAITAGVEVSEEILNEKRSAMESCNESFSSLTRALAVVKNDADRMRKQLEEKLTLEKQFAAQLKDIGLLEQLKDLVSNNKFMEFVAVEYLQDMAANANNLLLNLTNGRYFLVYGKNFEVGDNFNGGQLRGVHTLSGGETFLVSLSLALSLSTAIHQKSLRPIEFFFLDEGFGTLDGELVDTVMDSLEKLKNENFCIGIISHVEELKNRLENKITVKKADGEHGSSVQIY